MYPCATGSNGSTSAADPVHSPARLPDRPTPPRYNAGDKNNRLWDPMQRLARARTLLSFFALSWQGLACASPVYSPARLSEGDRSIEALLPVPQGLPIGLYVVSCEASVTAAGRP